MRALKILVVVMGVMLVAGFILLIVAIATRLSKKEAALPSARPFAAAPVDLPPGARIESMAAGTDRLVLDVVLPNGERRLLVIDLADGHPLGTIPLRSQP